MSISLKPMEKLPESKREKKTESAYERALLDFLDKQDCICAMISMDEVKPQSLASALRAKIATDERFKGKIAVRTRVIKGEQKVYLEKLEPTA